MTVLLDVTDKIATITLNRPEALNAFNSAQLMAVTEVARGLRGRRDVRCVIVTGAGDRAFAAGADIKEMANLSPVEGLAFGRLGHAMTAAFELLPQPVIAAVNGFALGGGCELALACDIRIASQNAVFAQPEVALGIPPGWGGSQRLTWAVGPGLASELILTGRRVKADEALRIGLVNAVYPQAELLIKAREMAAQIAANSPTAVRASKTLIRMARNGQQESGLQAEAQLFGLAFTTADQREGMQAFIEKRTPAFED